MRNFFRKIRNILFSPLVLGSFLSFKLKNDKRFPVPFFGMYPQIKDKTIKTNFDRHYVYHTAWAARKVKEIEPTRHIDISSSLYFSGILSSFIPIDFYDYRVAEIELPDLKSAHADLLHLPFKDNSVDSLSCMHVVEHIGLGRYGDPLDPEGDLKAIHELKRVISQGGSLLFVVPVGKPRIEFNAHRIYSLDMVLNYFDDFTLKEFTLIPEKSGPPIVNASEERVSRESYGCGCFWFIKK